jgi:hypothetical protein
MIKKIIVIFLFFIIFLTNISTGFNILNNPPYVPNDPYPINGAIDLDLDVVLTWSGGDPDPGDVVTYNVFFGANPTPPNVAVVHPTESFDPEDLTYNTVYYWKIDAYDNNMGVTEGPVWSFTTRDDNPPYVPSNPNPEDDEINVNTTLNIAWSGGDPDPFDIVFYDIYFGIDSNPPEIFPYFPQTSYFIEDLDYNTEYFWRIDAWDDYGYSTTGPVWSFTTKDDTPPYKPYDPNPADNQTNVSKNTDLSWSGGDPDPGDIVFYDVYFGTESNPPQLFLNHSNLTYELDVLDYNTEYFWRIDAWDDYGYSTTGDVWSFIIADDQPPVEPFDPLPSNGSTNIYIDSILRWNCIDPDDDTILYDIYFGTQNPPPLIETNYNDTEYSPGVMNITTTYYWRIVATDDYGYNSSSPIWSFTTSIYTNSPPNKPSKPSGSSSGRPGISYSYSSSTTDSNGEPIYYLFDWDDGTDSGWFGPFDSGVQVTRSHSWDLRGTYSVRVKAKDIYGGESVWSDPLSITMPKTNSFQYLIILIFEKYPFLEKIFNFL